MGLLSRFDLSTDLTRFFLGGLILVMIFVVLLTIISPNRGRKRLRGSKVDDRFVNRDGELID